MSDTKTNKQNAKEYLKEGDRICYKICGPSKTHGIFNGWDCIWAQTRTYESIHPSNIYKVNGINVDFTK